MLRLGNRSQSPRLKSARSFLGRKQYGEWFFAKRTHLGVERRCPHRLPSPPSPPSPPSREPLGLHSLPVSAVGRSGWEPKLHRFRGGGGSRGPQNEVFANMDGPVA